MKRERKPLGLFDWCILTLVAALAAFGAFGFWKYGNRVSPQVELECLFRLPESNKNAAFSVGDEVRSENGTVFFGRVTAVSSHPYQTVFLKDGAPVYEAVEGLTETELTVRVLAEKGEEYRVGDIRVSAGGKGTFRIGETLVSGVSVVRVSEGVKNGK